MSDDEDYVYIGTPIEWQESSGSYFSAAGSNQVDPGAVRAGPMEQQVVRDSEGRRRFHGAFTGGFSAGYYNTVGSKEGFEPRSFISSRGSRQAGESQQQSVEDFMDEDELEERQKRKLSTTAKFDTFGSRAARQQRQMAEQDAGRRDHFLPGPVLDVLVQPVATSIGVKLFERMGWRQGRGFAATSAPLPPEGTLPAGVSSSGAAAADETGAARSLENVAMHKLEPKVDRFGLGYDPHAGAEEFREAKRKRQEAAGEADGERRQKAGRGAAFRGMSFADDFEQELEDYVEDAPAVTKTRLLLSHHFEVASDGDDSDPGDAAPREALRLGAGEERPALTAHAHAAGRLGDSLEGFVRAEDGLACLHVVFPPPQLQPGFRCPRHAFAKPCPQLYGQPRATAGAAGRLGEPSAEGEPWQEAQPDPPKDEELRQRIEVFASFLAQKGDDFMRLTAHRLAGDPRFDFLQAQASDRGAELLLQGGVGSAYFRWKGWQARRAARLKQQAAARPAQRSRPLTADDRAMILGTAPLPEPRGPHAAAQGRGTGTMAAAGSTAPSVAPPTAAAAAASQQPTGLMTAAPIAAQQQPQPPKGLAGLVAGGIMSRFTSAGTLDTHAAAAAAAAAATTTAREGDADKERRALQPPERTISEWQPAPLLCKRFNLPEPAARTATAAETARFPNLAALSGMAGSAAFDPAAMGGAYSVDAEQAPAPAALPPPPPRGPPAGLAARRPGSRWDRSATTDSLPPPSAAALAEDFLSSLGGPWAASTTAVNEPAGTDTVAAAEPLEPEALARPYDLFSAIFEAASDDDDDDDDGGGGGDGERSDEDGGDGERDRGASAPATAAAAAASPAADAEAQKPGQAAEEEDFGPSLQSRDSARAAVGSTGSEAAPPPPEPETDLARALLQAQNTVQRVAEEAAAAGGVDNGLEEASSSSSSEMSDLEGTAAYRALLAAQGTAGGQKAEGPRGSTERNKKGKRRRRGEDGDGGREAGEEEESKAKKKKKKKKKSRSRSERTGAERPQGGSSRRELLQQAAELLLTRERAPQEVSHSQVQGLLQMLQSKKQPSSSSSSSKRHGKASKKRH